MVSRRPIDNETLVMVCPPYACVPYEPRKMFVCAYCFKEYRELEEKHKKSQEEAEGEESATKQETGEQVEKAVDSLSIDPVAAEAKDLAKQISEIQADEVKVTSAEVEAIVLEAANTEPEIEALLQCSGCHEVWYCNEECRLADLPEHGAYECVSLAKFDIPWAKEYYSYCDDLVTDIRLLLRAMNRRYWQLEQGINEYEEEYQLLISNMSCYAPDTLTSLRTIAAYTNYLLPDNIIIEDDELLEVYCKHRVNMFGLWANGGECLGYGVYPRASYFNHSCWPNTTFYKNPDLKVPHMNFLTVWPIEKEGEEVCISYIDISAGLKPRRDVLLDKYFFHCTCERCMLQEMHPEEPDPYHIYWAPAPPPDGYAPGYEPQETQNGDETPFTPPEDLNGAMAQEIDRLSIPVSSGSPAPLQAPPAVPEPIHS